MILTLLTIIGIIALYVGGDLLIKGAVSLSRNLNISPILVSSIIVGCGTSMPEFILSIEAVLLGTPEIAIGNVVGSNIANILFIGGIAGVISPFVIAYDKIKSHLLFMSLVTIIFIIFVNVWQQLSWIHGLILLLMAFGYLLLSYQQCRSGSSLESSCQLEEKRNNTLYSNQLAVIVSVAGMFLLAVGSAIFLYAAMQIALHFDISQEIIGLGLVAFGSSIPEFSAAVIASYKKKSSIVIGSILGSNIFNIALTTAVMALIEKITIPPHVLTIDIWILAAITILFCVVVLFYQRISRVIGCTFLALYLFYFYILFL
ncbi:MAG: calcium/sodium antiporter [Rickettsiales bacterium]|nr:calcium/sodium antiporter [Rickettsiales bacterium]